MTSQPQTNASRPLFRLAFYFVAIGLALVHVFITFRGLNSAAGMEQAQLAREIARGNGMQTKVVRPYALARFNASAKVVTPGQMPEITLSPLQPLLWAPVFKAMEIHFPFEPTKNGGIYLMDRAIACMGAVCLLLTLLWTHGAARRLFDDGVAAVAVSALILCEPLWKLSVSGSPVTLLLPLFALIIRLYASAQVRAQKELGIGLPMIAIGLLAGLMLLTHWMAVWIIFGLVLAVAYSFPGSRRSAGWVIALPLLAFAVWGAWLIQQSGDLLGGAKSLFQSHLLAQEPALLQREFSIVTPPVFVDDLLRKTAWNLTNQLTEIYAYLGHSVLALAFFAALLHRFRRPEVVRATHGIGLIFLSTAIGMGLLGLPDKVQDDNALYMVLVPAMVICGSAMLAVLWARLQINGGFFWQRFGFAIIAIAISAIPMMATLPGDLKMGLTLRNRIYPYWPPYVPSQVPVLKRLIAADEILFTDAPWFISWYADVPCAWMPVKRADFPTMQAQFSEQKVKVAGFVVTPVSTKMTYLLDAFTGPYSEWPDLIFRGPMLAFEKDFQPYPEFPYRIAFPLMAPIIGAKESRSYQMTFYSDRARSIKE
jgi:hypothetical protein